MRTVKWHMHNCPCVIQYDYDEQTGDVPDQRINHQIISPCSFHPDLEARELYDTLIKEMLDVASCNQKIGEIYSDLTYVTNPAEVLEGEAPIMATDPEKVMVGFNDKRDLVAVVVGLDASKMENLKTELEAITDRAVEVK